MGWAIVTAAIVQIEDKRHLRMTNEFLDAAHGGKFRVCVLKAGEFAVHVTMQSARTFDDAWEIEIWHNPDGTFGNLVAGGQERGRRKSPWLITLDAAHHKHGTRRSAKANGCEVQRKGIGRHGAANIHNAQHRDQPKAQGRKSAKPGLAQAGNASLAALRLLAADPDVRKAYLLHRAPFLIRRFVLYSTFGGKRSGLRFHWQGRAVWRSNNKQRNISECRHDMNI